MTVRILVGHVIDRLKELSDECVHCVVCSPPYYGLRDYGIEPQVWGGEPACEHEWGETIRPAKHSGDGNACSTLAGGKGTQAQNAQRHNITTAFCRCCTAWRGSLGLEPTPALYVEHMVAIFREVRRVLRKDGTLWLNIGDSYASNWNGTGGGPKASTLGIRDGKPGRSIKLWDVSARGSKRVPPGIKPKDLLGMPWALAFALRDDGWYLRSEITWAKRAPLPESVGDRPTSATEKVFLLTKSARYFYDSVAVAETIDADAVIEYTAAHASLYNVSDRAGRVEFPSRKAGKRRADSCLQNMLDSPNGRLASYPRGQGEIPFIQSETPRQTRTSSQDGGISSIREDEGGAGSLAQNTEGSGLSQSLSDFGEAQSSSEAPLRQRQGASFDRSLPPNGQGLRILDAERSQAPHAYDDDGVRSYGGSVASDQSEPGLPLQDMRRGETVDEGSYNPIEQGRDTYGEQHSGTMPELQQPQKQPTRNLRNFWLLSPEPFAAAHFATFPTEIPRRSILAGTSEKGVCPKCRAPWERYVDRETRPNIGLGVHPEAGGRPHRNPGGGVGTDQRKAYESGWQPTCEHAALDPVPATVLDPFFGAGTTGLVADQLQRHCIGIDLNPSYAAMAERRLRDDAGMFAEIAAE